MGEVTEGLVLDLALLAVGAAEQMGLVDATVIDASGRGYMNSTRSSRHSLRLPFIRDLVKREFANLVATLCI